MYMYLPSNPFSILSACQELNLTTCILNCRRTGKDIKAGKVIRKNADGFENFEDYLSESGIILSHIESLDINLV